MRTHLGAGSGPGLAVGAADHVLKRGRAATVRWPLADAAIGSALSIAPSVPIVSAFHLGSSATIGKSGLAVLVVAKLAAMAALGAGGGWRRSASRSERFAMIEAATLGSLLAFVASVALGRAAPLPRSFLVIDWAASLLLLLGAGLATARIGRPRRDIEPEIVATFRGRVIAATWPDEKGFRALRSHLRSLRPDRLVTANGREAIGRFREIRPDVVLVADDGGRSSANIVRGLANAAMREGVECFVLVTTGNGSGGPTLAERVVRAFAGLTRTRMVRVRAGRGPIDADLARRIARIAAKGKDGAAYPPGNDDWESDAATLWREWDTM